MANPEKIISGNSREEIPLLSKQETIAKLNEILLQLGELPTVKAYKMFSEGMVKNPKDGSTLEASEKIASHPDVILYKELKEVTFLELELPD